jgi:hypothetical protein
MPKTFEELDTNAHDIKLSIAAHRGKTPIQYPNKSKDKQDFKIGNKLFSKTEARESMVTFVTPIKISSNVTQKVTKNVDPLQERKNVTVEER